MLPSSRCYLYGFTGTIFQSIISESGSTGTHPMPHYETLSRVRGQLLSMRLCSDWWKRMRRGADVISVQSTSAARAASSLIPQKQKKLQCPHSKARVESMR